MPHLMRARDKRRATRLPGRDIATEGVWRPPCKALRLFEAFAEVRGLAGDGETVGASAHRGVTPTMARPHRVKQIARVKDVMTRDPITIEPDAPIETAIETMKKKAIRHLPVVDDRDQLVGVVTDRDLRHAMFSPVVTELLGRGARRRLQGLSQEVKKLRVKHVMTWVVTTTHPEATVAQAAVVMFEQRLGCLPVVKNGKLMGIVTEIDLLRALRAEHQVLLEPESRLW
jgi:CBS domain-containing protein